MDISYESDIEKVFDRKSRFRHLQTTSISRRANVEWMRPDVHQETLTAMTVQYSNISIISIRDEPIVSPCVC